MKILFINQVVGPLFSELLFAKSNNFTELSVICGSGGELVKKYGARTIAAPAYQKTSITKRVLSWISFSFFVFRFIWRDGRSYDLILFSTNGPLNTVSIAFLHFFRRINNFEYMVYDIYPEVIFQRWPLSKYVIFPLMIFRLIDSYVIKNSKQVFTLSNGMSETIKKRSEIAYTQDLTVLPVVASAPQIDDSVEISRQKVELIIGEKLNNLVLVYSGNLGFQHDLTNLIKAIIKPDFCNDISLIICGDGELLNEYLQISFGSKNIKFLPFQEKSQFDALLNCADISIVSLGGGFGSILMPSKFATYISFGLPVILIGDEKSELGELINNNQIGWTLSASKLKKIDQLLFSLISDDAAIPSRTKVTEYFYNFHTTKFLRKVLNEKNK